jgi:hypothetical protein
MSQQPVEGARDDSERVSAAGERVILETFLDLYREVIRNKVSGLSDEGAVRRLVPSATTPGGIVKHLRWVELNWFQRVLAGRPESDFPPPPWSDEDPDGDFRLEPGETLAQVLADYDAECERSRATAARYSLDDTGTHRRMGATSLRWIYIHMIEETARHAGHADILREQLDGSTGD